MPQDGLSTSMKQSAYFTMENSYDKDVYENDLTNWVKIISMLALFYVFQGLHWWANFELGTNDTEMSTLYNLVVFATAVIVIGFMLFFGAKVNRKKLTHEFWVEKISEEHQRLVEEQQKVKQHKTTAD